MATKPSSSSFSDKFTYEVFLSFRGKDTRYGFTGNLYSALRYKGIHTFFDDEELQRGDEITPALEKAIEESRIFIIVLSQNYASSSFCLDELAHILKFAKGKGLLFFPIFYKVIPSDVGHHKGSFGEALAIHEQKYKVSSEKLETWKTALKVIAKVSGDTFKYDGKRYEEEFIKEIVEFVSNKINRRATLPHVADCLVGLEPRKLKVEALVDVGSDDVVHMVGIHGPGGMGKTTLAVEVYNSIAGHFEALCFLEDVRKHGLTHLQSILLSETIGEKKIKLTSVRQGISIIQQRLQQKKVLLLLDDVDKREQLEAIVGKPDWFGLGSRVIITTRNKQLLASHGVERTYEVKKLKKEDALQLLSSKAFKSQKFGPCYQNVLNEAVTYASGLPLALKVIGSNLCGKPIEHWKSALNQYKRSPNKEIQQVLKVSYDGLEKEEQSVFLDISCCFKGYTLTEVEDILGAHYDGHCMKNHINVLVDRSLISLCDSIVTLHDLIEEMGKEIVRNESKDPGKCSRLWFREDIVDVLEENKGTSQIEIIHMDFGDFKEVEWDGNAFKEMKNLKTLIIKGWNDIFSTGPKYLPNSLRVLEWWRYPSQDFPKDFYPKKLAICNLHRSKCTSSGFVTLFGKKFTNLTSLNFDECENLTEIPDVSGLKGLKELSFMSCDNLLTAHESVGLLEKLRILNAGYCRKLKIFPPIKLTSLEQLHLDSCGSLENFPEVSGKMENIKYLSLDGTSMKKFPLSFENLTGLEELDLSLSNFEILPECFKEFRSLTTLSLNNCKSLQEILGIPPNLKFFTACECNSLTSKCKSMLLSQELHEAGYTNFCLPNAEIPDWFEHQSRGVPISFRVRKELPAIAICFHMASVDDYSLLEYEGYDGCQYLYRLEDGLVYSISEEVLLKSGSLILIINGNEHDCFTFFMNPNDTYLFDLREILRTEVANLIVKPKGRTEDKLNEALSKKEWINVQIIYKYDGRRTLMKSGIHVLKEQSRDDIHFIDDLNSSDIESENMEVAEAKTLEDIDFIDDLNSSDIESENMEVAERKSLYWRESSDSEDSDDDICEVPNRRFTSPELVGFLSKKKFKNLTNLNFDECQFLTEIPDVSFLQQLENLSFQQCHNLLTIHESVGSLEKLKILKARCCCKLKSFPPINLASLEQLDLANCYSLESFPEISGKMENITKLNLDRTSSCGDAAIFLWNISMRPKEDESVEEVSSTVSSNIQHLSLRNCNLSNEFFAIALQCLPNVKVLDLSENNFTVIPESIKECRFLTKLTLERCWYLQEIRGLPPNLKHFSARECLSLTSVSRSMSLDQKLHEAGNTNFYLPGADIPEWFERQKKRKLEHENQQWLKKHKLVDMEVADTKHTLIDAIRNWKGPDRVRTLIWEFRTDTLLTNQVRYMSDSTADPSCHRCGNEIESADHVFRHCGIARAVWYLLLPAPKHTTFFTQEREQWIIDNLRDDQMVKGRRWSLIFGVALDVLWLRRNYCFILENCKDFPTTISSRILVEVDAFVEKIEHFEHMELSVGDFSLVLNLYSLSRSQKK